jgi:squalene-hopene/tetraprenyl-beta-curcumene cyclase
VLAALAASSLHAEPPRPGDWSPKAAAAYLDSRAAWWMEWKGAQRDHGTFCVSCHTALPYALARPALRAALEEREPSPPEARLLESVARRVALWRDVEPFYPDQLRGIPKTSESRGTESILNALILATRDAHGGRLSDETRGALQNMWALQMKTQKLKGAWAWLDFGYEPWESTAAPYFGAALAALAVGTAPGGYSSSPEIEPGLKLLHEHLRGELERQPLVNRVAVLWASARAPGLLTAEQAQSIAQAALARQRDDGGWSTSSLGEWKRRDGSALDAKSDGYATGLVTLALQRADLASAGPALRRGLDWLARNQDASGRWSASSQNKQHEPQADAGLFMSDAATAFAALSLTQARAAR